MSNTETYCALVSTFIRTFEQKCYRFTSDVPDSVLTLRAKLVDEELTEYNEALRALDKLEMLDALCDLTYVVAGTLLVCGLKPIPHTSNGTNYKLIWAVEPHISNIVDECSQTLPCHKRMFRWCTNALIALDNVGYKLHMYEAFQKVHTNNMLKLWRKPPFDDINLTATQKGPRAWLVRNKYGKIIKPLNHPKVDLREFIV